MSGSGSVGKMAVVSGAAAGIRSVQTIKRTAEPFDLVEAFHSWPKTTRLS
ncbi:hypothetical protein [Tardibacter chloracetimidivorans]|jgi:hypothetical protein|nr:hypothetical protein [Tardibacter chloracetimidivorans]